MKLLMTTDTVGGVWQYALELARSLGHRADIALATMGAPLTDAQAHAAAQLRNVQVFESSYKLEWMQDPWEDVKAFGQWLLELEQQVRPDVIHSNGYAHGALPFRAPIMVVGHSCVVSWWSAVKHEDAPSEWNAYRNAVASGLHEADMVVAPSHTMLAALQHHYGPLRAITKVIYNGRDASVYRPAPKQQFILSAGRVWDEAKNVATLAKVAPDLPWPVCVAGEEKHPDGGKAQADNIVRLGRLDEPALARFFSQAAIYCLPARYEPFGLSAVEAGLAGCALVLGDIPSLREVWGDAAAFVPPDDPLALRRTLLELISSPSLRTDLALKASDRARQFTPGMMSDAYMASYRQLMRMSRAIGIQQPELGSAARLKTGTAAPS